MLLCPPRQLTARLPAAPAARNSSPTRLALPHPAAPAGALPPTAGDALIYGESLRGEGGLDRVRSLMGVCPQFDVLWNELSGHEHLIIYGHIKGLKFSEVRLWMRGRARGGRGSRAGAARDRGRAEG
jgi:hypothetical protein